MKHPTEERLIAYRDGEVAGREAIALHLAECPECREELERIEGVLAAFANLPTPDPGEDYGGRVWQQIAPRLAKRRPWSAWGLDRWFEPRRLAAAGALAAVIVAAFLAGRFWKPNGGIIAERDAGQVRERVLIVAVGGHLDRSEMVLVELSNAERNPGGNKLIDISAEQRRAEDLLEENRLYRQTASQHGDAALASVLEDLERVLIDLAHSPQEVTPAQFETIRRRIEARGILFKVRVVGKELRERKSEGKPAPSNKEADARERNKA